MQSLESTIASRLRNSLHLILHLKTELGIPQVSTGGLRRVVRHYNVRECSQSNDVDLPSESASGGSIITGSNESQTDDKSYLNSRYTIQTDPPIHCRGIHGVDAPRVPALGSMPTIAVDHEEEKLYTLTFNAEEQHQQQPIYSHMGFLGPQQGVP
ncbi:hypothetical protein VKT23_019678 [Stygiomarasmius scandens]|uniref:RHD domain-containing protein n=1 Tax=Marasmiellus scandens TaxID=2682957 RepID=A0ABR1INQ5_9AGAR